MLNVVITVLMRKNGTNNTDLGSFRVQSIGVKIGLNGKLALSIKLSLSLRFKNRNVIVKMVTV